MVRSSIQIKIPKQYIENEKKGLCRVCGKPIKKPFRKYCSNKCSIEYSKCFKTWGSLREQALERDNYRCVECEVKSKYLEVDHIKAIINGGDMWDINNLRTLCYPCHKKKTRLDLYKRKYVSKDQIILKKGYGRSYGY